MNADERGSKNENYLTLPALQGQGRIVHAFTTRKNGLGERTKGFKQPDDWNSMAAEFGITPDRLITVNQVHGDTIVRVEEENHRQLRSVDADALITQAPGMAIGIETADCVPVLLLDPAVPAIAAVHAGWRSTVGKIVQKTVQRMRDEFGCEPSRMQAAIGPAIGPECYEVDEPVMGQVRRQFPFWRDVASARGGDKWGLDLAKLNRMELVQAGLADSSVHTIGLCTSCRRDLFYSFRAEGRTGRMLSVIMIQA